MAVNENEKDRKDQPKEDILLVAQVRARLLDGESFDLLPFRHEDDVRSAVNDFIEEWTKTGFLLRDGFIYPWSQVKAIEVISVEALTHDQARPYSELWEKDAQAQTAFWKTRKPRGKKEDKKDGGGK